LIVIKAINMNNNTFVHKYLKGLITKEDVVVDMTAGNGNDTFFLCNLAKKVIALDIQEQAINNTLKRCKDFYNLEIYQDNFVNIDHYVKEDITLFLFNLGYLPGSDETIITKAQDSLFAMQKAYSLLKENGYLVISFYIGHQGGKEEYYLLDQFIQDKKWLILERYQQANHYKQPLTYIIKKKRP